MGMAASQARYLGLAARKTNVEYQGQQINQSRLALANQSAELWNQMLGLSVPTVPDTQDFTKTQYSFSDGYNDFEITSFVPTDEVIDGVEYNYAVKYRYFEQEVQGLEKTNTNPQIQKIDITGVKGATAAITAAVGDVPAKITVDGTDYNATQVEVGSLDTATQQSLVLAGIITEADITNNIQISQFGTSGYFAKSGDVNASELVMTSNYQVGNDNAELVDLTDSETLSALKKIMENNPNTEMADAIKNAIDNGENEIYVYEKNGQTYYACKEDFEASYASGTRPSNDPHTLSGIDRQDALKQYYTTSVKVERETSDYAIMDDASGSGRFSTIKLANYSSPFELNTETTKDDEGYQDALNQYYYDTQMYEKAQNDINAKTQAIQEQDRTLELRLKQLDTEHSALQTEMEAVKKVLSKNVEDTFKTFGG